MASCSSSAKLWARRSAVLVVAAASCLLSGCLEMYLKKEPLHTLPPPPPPASPRAKATGSLWRDDVSANYLFADTKARFAGDLLTIVITEDSQGSKAADTNTKTETEIFASLEQFFGLPQQVAKHQPNLDPTQLVKGTSSRKWDGEGTTNRSGKLTARMSATVKAVSPTGNLWVEGDKIVSVNKEDQHIVVQGWVRPEDIDSQNQVLSTRLADARIDYYGIGVVGAKQRQPWGFWVFDLVWPF